MIFKSSQLEEISTIDKTKRKIESIPNTTVIKSEVLVKMVSITRLTALVTIRRTMPA